MFCQSHVCVLHSKANTYTQAKWPTMIPVQSPIHTVRPGYWSYQCQLKYHTSKKIPLSLLIYKMGKPNRKQTACKCKKKKWEDIFSSAYFIPLFCQFYAKNVLLCFEYELMYHHMYQPYWFIWFQWRAEKGLVTCLILLPHMQALFMTSQIQTAGHKMAALRVMFLWLSHVDFLVF